MPYASVKDAPKWVKELGEAKARQWIAVFNSVFSETHDESRAFAAAGSAVKKVQGGSMDEFRRYVAIEKIDHDQRMVWGYASTPDLDSQGDRVAIKAIDDALPEYMKFGNIREMHQASAVGKAKTAEIDENGLYLGAKVVDDAAWRKVKEGVYSGFSIGGRIKKREGDEILGLDLVEISLVDRPANPAATFDIWKSQGVESPAKESEAAAPTKENAEVPETSKKPITVVEVTKVYGGLALMDKEIS